MIIFMSILQALEEEKKQQEKSNKLKKIEVLAYKWFDGKISDRRLAEAVFGLMNGEVMKSKEPLSAVTE